MQKPPETMIVTQQLGINVIICEKESITEFSELDEDQRTSNRCYL